MFNLLLVPRYFQMKKVFDYARLKTAELQGLSFRHWTLFNTFMRCTTVEQHGMYLGCEGMDNGPWSAQDLPVSPMMFRSFLWWMATPSVEVTLDVKSHTPLEKMLVNCGPRGFTYTTTSAVSYNLLSFLEDKECQQELKGKFVEHGDVSSLFREKSMVMKRIAL